MFSVNRSIFYFLLITTIGAVAAYYIVNTAYANWYEQYDMIG